MYFPYFINIMPKRTTETDKAVQTLLFIKQLKNIFKFKTSYDIIIIISSSSSNQHPMAFQVPYARTDIFKYISSQTPLGTGMHASIIFSAESSADSVARFTSLVRSRD